MARWAEPSLEIAMSRDEEPKTAAAGWEYCSANAETKETFSREEARLLKWRAGCTLVYLPDLLANWHGFKVTFALQTAQIESLNLTFHSSNLGAFSSSCPRKAGHLIYLYYVSVKCTRCLKGETDGRTASDSPGYPWDSPRSWRKFAS